MKTFSVEEAKCNFDELMNLAQQGLTVIVTDSDSREYELVLKPLPLNKPRQSGSARGQVKIAEDFDEPLPEFEPYSE